VTKVYLGGKAERLWVLVLRSEEDDSEKIEAMQEIPVTDILLIASVSMTDKTLIASVIPWSFQMCVASGSSMGPIGEDGGHAGDTGRTDKTLIASVIPWSFQMCVASGSSMG
jgi:hypothetical protein